MTSSNFLRSQYCLFEGGAGWATRGVSDYLKLNMDWNSIPVFLTNGKAEMTVISGSGSSRSIELSVDLHNYLVQAVFNPMIKHLNRGRRIANKKKIKKFSVAELPSALELQKSGKAALDYRDPEIVEHWDARVSPGVKDYLATYGATS